MPTELFIDTDPGVDDVLALLFALHSPDTKVVGISLTHGNAPLKAVTENVKTLFDIIEVHQTHSKTVEHDVPWQIYSDQITVSIGADKPLKGQNQFAVDVHGSDGLGGLNKKDYADLHSQFGHHSVSKPLYKMSDFDAADEFIHQLKSRPAKTLSFVALGPMTNFALALQREPELIKKKLRGLYIMGGCLQQPYPGGNVTPHAEFNFYADTFAADFVMQAATSDDGFECPVVVVPLDATEKVRLQYKVYQEHIVPLAKHAALPKFCTLFLEYIFNVIYDFRQSIVDKNTSSLAMHDPMAVAIAMDDHFYGGKSSLIKQVKQLQYARVVCQEDDKPCLTKGQFLSDGRRWRRRTSNENLKEVVLGESKKGVVLAVMDVDANVFFEKFMKRVFGVTWNAEQHAWVDTQ